jgi:hypothetical protein
MGVGQLLGGAGWGILYLKLYTHWCPKWVSKMDVQNWCPKLVSNVQKKVRKKVGKKVGKKFGKKFGKIVGKLTNCWRGGEGGREGGRGRWRFVIPMPEAINLQAKI